MEISLWTSGPENTVGFGLATRRDSGEPDRLVVTVRLHEGTYSMLLDRENADELHAALGDWLAL